MGIEVGDIIYARLYTTSPKLTEFTHLLPRFVNCKVLKVISDTVLLVENLATGKKFTRSIRDLFPMKAIASWPLHYLENGRSAMKKRATEDLFEIEDLLRSLDVTTEESMAARMQDFERFDSDFKTRSDAEVDHETLETPVEGMEGSRDEAKKKPEASGQVKEDANPTQAPAEQRGPRRSTRLAKKISA